MSDYPDFNSLFGNRPPFERRPEVDPESGARQMLIAKSLHMALKLAKMDKHIGYLLAKLREFEVVVELGLDDSQPVLTRRVNDFTVLYNNDHSGFMMLFGIIISGEFERTVPTYDEFARFVCEHKADIVKPDDANALNKIMPMYCNLLDFAENDEVGKSLFD